MRRFLGLLVVAGLALAGLVAPAAGQSIPPPPTLTIDTFATLRPAGCANVGDNFDLRIGGATNQSSVGVVMYSPTGSAINKASTPQSSGRWNTSLVWNYAQTGTYELRASAGSAAPVSAYLEVPCQAPTLEYAPTCFTPGVTTRVRMTARHFAPFGTGYVDYDVNGSEAKSAIRLPNDGHGVFFADFSVTPSDRPHPGQASDANKGVVADATWSPCPPPTTTTSSTAPTVTTTTAATTTTVGETSTTTTRPGIPTTTLPPTIELPPPTPGATLTVTPKVGPAGFVTGAVGTGFPPGPVELTWSPGIGKTVAIAGPDGTFSVRALILPRDRLGPRALIATGGGVTAFDGFLVVPSSVQPSSGSQVAQITRIRRFLQR